MVYRRFKAYSILLIIDAINQLNSYSSGKIKDTECHDCRYKASNFQDLKSHYLQLHRKSWTYESKEVLETKPKSLLDGEVFKGCKYICINDTFI